LPQRIEILNGSTVLAAAAPNNPAAVRLAFAVPVGFRIPIEGRAQAGPLIYAGSAMVTIPAQLPPAPVGMQLQLTNPQAIPADRCPGLTDQARAVSNNLAQLKAAVEALRVAGCSTSDFDPILQKLTQDRLREIIGRINAAVQNCRFQDAAREAAILQAEFPSHAWLGSGLPQVNDLAARQGRVDAILSRVRRSLDDPAAARPLIADARSAAGGEQCLLDAIGAVERQIRTETPVQPPTPPPPPGPPGPCNGAISANPRAGYAEEFFVVTVVIPPPAAIAKVMIRGLPGSDFAGSGSNSFSRRLRFQGREGDVPLTIDALDANGRLVCFQSITVQSRGLRK
jgi:hypothetical protein